MSVSDVLSLLRLLVSIIDIILRHYMSKKQAATTCDSDGSPFYSGFAYSLRM